jgi:hypothetical protein
MQNSGAKSFMTLYTERSNASVIDVTHFTVFFTASSNGKDTSLWKRKGTEIHLSAPQKFLSEVTGLSARNVDRGVCMTKLLAFDRCKYLYGLLVAGNKT